MKIVKTDDEVMKLSGGGGGLAFVGFLLLAGAAAIVFFVRRAGGELFGIHLIPAGVLAFLGLLLAFGRSGMILDRTCGTAEKWWGLAFGVKLWTRETSLSGLDRVALESRVQGSGKNRHRVYPVALAGGAEPLEVDAHLEYPESRRLAERLSRFFGVPLHDDAEGTLTVREPDFLDESLAEQAARLGKPEALPEPPQEMLSAIEDDGETLSITAPAAGFTAFHKAVLALVLGIGALTTVSGRLGALVIFIPIALFVSQHALERTIFKADARRFSVRKVGLVSRMKQSFPAEDVEELFVSLPRWEHPSSQKEVPERLRGFADSVAAFAGRAVMVARSDKMSLTVPVTVDPAEAEYLAALLRARLAGTG